MAAGSGHAPRPLNGPKGRLDPAGRQKPILGATSQEPRELDWPPGKGSLGQEHVAKVTPATQPVGDPKEAAKSQHCSPSQLVLRTPR